MNKAGMECMEDTSILCTGPVPTIKATMDTRVAAIIMDILHHVNLGTTCQRWIPLLIMVVLPTTPMVSCVLVVGRVTIATLLLSLATKKLAPTRKPVHANTTSVMADNPTTHVAQSPSMIVHLMGLLEMA